MRSSRRGNAALIVGLSLVLLLGVAAVVVDVGYGRLTREQLQNAADASALAAAARLDGTDAGLADARLTALSIAAANSAGGDAVVLDDNSANAADGDVVLGAFDAATGAFVPSDDANEINAVEVRARIASLGLFVAPVALGRDNVPVGAIARTYVATGGAAATDCFIPLGMPACLVDHYGLSGLQNVMLKLNPPSIDNVGYARPNGSPNAAWTRSQLTNCRNSGEVAIGDPLGLQNGTTTSALADFVTALEESTTRWDPNKWGARPPQDADSSVRAAKYGNTFEGVVPVFDGGNSYCQGSGGQFNGSAPLVGFVWGAVYDVVNKGSSGNRTIKMRLDFTQTYDFGTQMGGPEWGVVSSDVRLVPGG